MSTPITNVSSIGGFRRAPMDVRSRLSRTSFSAIRELNTTELEAHLLRARLGAQLLGHAFKGNFSAFYGDYDKLYQNFYASELRRDYEHRRARWLPRRTTERQNTILSGDLIGELETGDFATHSDRRRRSSSTLRPIRFRFNSFFDTSAADGTSHRPRELLSRRRTARSDQRSRNVLVRRSDRRRNNFTTDSERRYARRESRSLSFYLQDEIELSERFDLTLGARFDSFDIEVLERPGKRDSNPEETRRSRRASGWCSSHGRTSLSTEATASLSCPAAESSLPTSTVTTTGLIRTPSPTWRPAVKWDFSRRLEPDGGVL